jgi:hypothetical protein
VREQMPRSVTVIPIDLGTVRVERWDDRLVVTLYYRLADGTYTAKSLGGFPYPSCPREHVEGHVCEPETVLINGKEWVPAYE